MKFGFEHGDGWFHIINNLCFQIQQHIDWSRRNRAITIQFNRALKRWVDNGDDRGLIWYFTIGDAVNTRHIERVKKTPKYREVSEVCYQVVAVQVKEKYGTLRFYTNGGDEFTDGLIRMAEAMSSETCEVCGDKGKLNRDGWISCRCQKHRNE
jgi:hypothetical protein